MQKTSDPSFSSAEVPNAFLADKTKRTVSVHEFCTEECLKERTDNFRLQAKLTSS